MKKSPAKMKKSSSFKMKSPFKKAKGLDGKACWKGFKLQGTKKKGGKTPAEYEEVKEVANRDGTFDDYDEIDDQAVQEMLEEIGKTPIKKAGGGLAYMLGE